MNNSSIVNHSSRLLISVIVLFSSLFFSCQKEPDKLGLGITPVGDRLNLRYCDTSTVIAYSVYDDSVRTDQVSPTLLGSIYDPVFGKTVASIYTQLSLSEYDYDFGTQPVLDSLVLQLQYNGYYGDTTTPMTVKIYEMADTLSLDSVYYYNQKANIHSQELARYTFYPHPTDSVKIDTVKYAPYLRIKLNSILGNKILNASATNLSSSDNFKKYINGIYLTATPVNASGQGSILYFNLLGTYSGLKLYYHNTTDTLAFNLVVDSYTPFFNHFDHFGYRHANAAFRQQLNGDTLKGKDKIYVQAMGGVRVKLRFPYLKHLLDSGKIAINEAQLIFKNADTDGKYAPPSSLNLMRYTENGGHKGYLADYVDEGTTFFDGVYNSTSKTYRFRISRYLQQLLDGKVGAYGLSLQNSANAPRLILNGSNATTGKIKLQLIYTRLQK